MQSQSINRVLPCLVALCLTTALVADDFDLAWRTIDAGGVTTSSGGGFELSGTLAQADAGISTGGDFQLLGGFWPIAAVCGCPGDVNHDGNRDGTDIQDFIDCLTASGHCVCADVDGINGPAIDDVAVFVNNLLTGAACP